MQKSQYLKRDRNPDVRISKTLSFLLKYGAVKEGLKVDKAGFVKVEDILQLLFFRYKKVTAEKIQQLVETNEKRRYELKTENDENGIPVLYIRAAQGNAMNVNFAIIRFL